MGYLQPAEHLSGNYPSFRTANGFEVYHRSPESTTECITPAPEVATSTAGPPTATTSPPTPTAPAPAPAPAPGPGPGSNSPQNIQSATAIKLHALVQHIYAAQARVQLEANEIKNAQGVATSAQKSLEEAANNVRVITAALQTAQQEVAAAAVRAQTAQMQLAAHDQLLFAARQKVDALSSQMVGLQVEDGVVAPKSLVNMQQLLAQLKEPLPPAQTPTPIPPVDNARNSDGPKSSDNKGLKDTDYYYI